MQEMSEKKEFEFRTDVFSTKTIISRIDQKSSDIQIKIAIIEKIANSGNN